MNDTFTNYSWLNKIILAFLLGFGWAAGTFTWAALVSLVGALG